MSTKVTPEHPTEAPERGDWEAYRESAPSLLREEEPGFPRYVGGVGALLALFGLLGMLGTTGLSRFLPLLAWIGASRAALCLAVGVAGMLFHAVSDKDLQVRRLYWIFGLLLLAAGVVAAVVPYQGAVGGLFLPGFTSAGLALLFLLAFLRNETEAPQRDLTVNALGAAGGAMAVVGFLGSNIWGEHFLLPYGFFTALLGLAYLTAYVSARGVGDDAGYRAGLGMGLLGAAFLVTAVVRVAVLPALGVASQPVPIGLLLTVLALLYVLVSVGLCSDNALVVMTRRELMSLFFSPIAYFVLVGMSVVAWVLYLFFLGEAVPAVSMFGQRPPLVEPIIRRFLFGLGPVFCMISVVPLLTMRLLSEEKRAGTLEVLLTAPVNETTVVLSKFFAVLIFFLVLWLPWTFYLVDLRVEGGKAFDYAPLLSFFVALAFMGSAFLSMGLFFSSLVPNQIVSAVLTFGGMIVLTFASLAPWEFEDAGTAWTTILSHISYLQLWWDSSQGVLLPKPLLFHASATIFWLFLTVKVLEARRWS
jgi:hypothetical protein